MTPAQAATTIRAAMERAYRESPEYRAVVERELRGLASVPVPDGARERCWERAREEVLRK